MKSNSFTREAVVNRAAAFLAVVGVMAVCSLLPVTGYAVDTNAVPAAWMTDASLSDNSDNVTFSSDAPGSITVTFVEQGGIPSYIRADVVADAGVEGSPFVGNYEAAGVEGFTFRLTGDGSVPVGAMAFLVGADSGRQWFNPNVSASAVAGEAVVNPMSFDLASGWVTDAQGDLAAMWEQDIASVGAIGVRLSPNGVRAQSYTIDEFRLVGEDGSLTPPAALTPLEQALLDRFGVKSVGELTDVQKQQDSDGDGMSDLVEILAENDASYADSVFTADIAPGAAGEGIVVKWACVKGYLYTVFRSTDLMDGFHAIAEATDLTAEATGYMTYTDVSATGEGPYFYRIFRK